ncbi:MAG: nuclear transport factor 2 family protein [bacterium]|nr:nuclear transport factor 2 family protein [bacterium]
MRNSMLFTLSLVLAVMLVGVASADRRAERQIRAEYDKTIRYTKQKNVDGLLNQMASGFLYKTRDGQVLNKQMIEMVMRQEFARYRSIDKRTTTIKKMEIKGDTARVTTVERIAVTLVDPQGKLRKVENRSTTRDTWVRTPQGWKVKMTEILDEETFIDGKRQPVS